jgi:cytochrome b6-f complex iron-sulfur subunit
MNKPGRPLPSVLGRREVLIGGASLLGLTACGAATTGSGSYQSNAGGSCTGQVYVTQAASKFQAGSPVYYGDINAFVVRDSKGLYAISAVCTHAGCTVNAGAVGGFDCPCHGSTFDENADVTGGPAQLPLPHFSLCLTSSGEVAVDPSTAVEPGTRLSA